MDGACAGVGAIAAGTDCRSGCDERRGRRPGGVLAAGLCGALIGFLVYNFRPASIFLGDSGSLFVGFLLGRPDGSARSGSEPAVRGRAAAGPRRWPSRSSTRRSSPSRGSSRAARLRRAAPTTRLTGWWRWASRRSRRSCSSTAWPGCRGSARLASCTAAPVGDLRRRRSVSAPAARLVALLRVRAYGGRRLLARARRQVGPVVGVPAQAPRLRAALRPAAGGRRLLHLLPDSLRHRGASRLLPHVPASLPIVIACQIVSLRLSGAYGVIWRYFGMTELVPLFGASCFGAASSQPVARLPVPLREPLARRLPDLRGDRSPAF